MSFAWPWQRKRSRMFSLTPQWKEMMIVTGPGGQFTLDFWMGNPTVCLPPEERWREIAPAWAAEHWHELQDALSDWCRRNGAKLEIDPKAGVY